jgi:uncharacterized protein (TIGR03437 family)
MDLNRVLRLAVCAPILVLAHPAWAVPKLRLSNTVVGPVSVAQGQNATHPDLEAYGATGERGANTETSLLRLTLSSTAPWVTASVGGARQCFGREGQCLPIQFSFSTTSLQPGQYSATVTVSDPAAIDAPQNILVLLSVGSNLADRLNLFVAPVSGSVDTVRFSTNSNVAASASTQSGGFWLSVAFRGIGTFDFVRPYEVAARYLDGMSAGTYQGSVVVSGSRVPADNKSVPVTLNVTPNPIADAARANVRFRLHQNSVKVARTIRINNRGQGTLSLSGTTASTSAGGDWLAAEVVPDTTIVRLTAEAKETPPGVYRGSVSVAGNAANAPTVIPVEMEVVAAGPPLITFRGVRDVATQAEGDDLARGGVVSAFGEAFSFEEPQTAASAPHPKELGGATVFVNDIQAPISYSSYGQVNFQVPFETPVGEAVVRIDRGTTRGGTSSIVVREAVPKMVRRTLRDEGVNIPEFRDYFGIALHQDGSASLPTEFGIGNTRPTKRGETIAMFAIGLGQTSPTAVTGAEGSPEQQVLSSSKRVCFGCLALGGIVVDAVSVGLAPGFVGFYLVTAVVPPETPSGDVAVRVLLDSASSEYGLIAVE